MSRGKYLGVYLMLHRLRMLLPVAIKVTITCLFISKMMRFLVLNIGHGLWSPGDLGVGRNRSIHTDASSRDTVPIDNGVVWRRSGPFLQESTM